jgi:hypothetical protein
VAVVHVQRLGIVLSISPVQSVPGAFGVHPESLSSTLIKYHLFFLFLLSLSHVFVLVKGQRVTTWHCDVLQKKKDLGSGIIILYSTCMQCAAMYKEMKMHTFSLTK